MNYGFNIPQYTPDILGASNAARNRLLQEQQLRQQGLDKMFNSWAQYGQQKNANEQAEIVRQAQAAEAAKARAAQMEEAARARAAQAVEAEKNRQWQSAENALNRQATADDNYAKGLRAAQPRYMEAVAKLQDNPNDVAAKLTVSQLKEQYPEIDTYEDKSIEKDVLAQALANKKKAEENAMLNRISDSNLRDFQSQMPVTIKDEATRQKWLKKAVNWRDNGYLTESDFAKIQEKLNNTVSTESRIAEAVAAAIAAANGKKTTDKLNEQDIQAKADEAIANKMSDSAIRRKYGDEVLTEVKSRRNNTKAGK